MAAREAKATHRSPEARPGFRGPASGSAADAGIAAAFNTPIGVMFAVELMMVEVSVRTSLAVAIATDTATFVGTRDRLRKDYTSGRYLPAVTGKELPRWTRRVSTPLPVGSRKPG